MQPKSKTLLFILFAFLLGGVGGLVVGKSYYGSSSRHRVTREEVRKEFTERLKIDDRQRALIDSLLESYKEKFSETRKQFSEDLRKRRDSLRVEIRKQLSEEQNRLYDAYIKELDERESRERERPR